MANEVVWRLRGSASDQVVGRLALPSSGLITIGRASDANLILPDPSVSRRHASLIITNDAIEIADTNSANGCFIDGRPIEKESWFAGETLEIGPYLLQVVKGPQTLSRRPQEQTENLFPPPFFDRPVVSLANLRGSGRISVEVDYLALGGGIGSFAWVDHLRVFGVSAQQIRVLGIDPLPYAKYKRLCEFSQIPDHERLRSNSISTPDNIWGFPGYASREAWRDAMRGKLGSLKYVLQVFGEPTLNASYTPRAGDVYKSIDREAARIGWAAMFVPGRILKIRKTDDGRYAVAYRTPASFAASDRRDHYAIARYIHVALGYPATRFLDDLHAFKHQHPGSARVVNAYEDHGAVYEMLAARGGSVVVRGRGIVASRILQRLSEVRHENKDVRILHLMRNPIKQGRQYDFARRHVAHDMELQPFNWPKACWGGTLRKRLEDTPPDDRHMLLGKWGGTTTADRPDWEQLIEDGKREGWYQPYFGKVLSVSLQGDQLVTSIESVGAFSEVVTLRADFIIDCTGLVADLRINPVIDDLVNIYSLRRNVADRRKGHAKMSGLHVNNNFEVEGMRNGDARAFASGVVTLNGPYAAVDSFLGLQYAALRSVDALYSENATGVSAFGPLRSGRQWLKWCVNMSP